MLFWKEKIPTRDKEAPSVRAARGAGAQGDARKAIVIHKADHMNFLGGSRKPETATTTVPEPETATTTAPAPAPAASMPAPVTAPAPVAAPATATPPPAVTAPGRPARRRTTSNETPLSDALALIVLIGIIYVNVLIWHTGATFTIAGIEQLFGPITASSMGIAVPFVGAIDVRYIIPALLSIIQYKFRPNYIRWNGGLLPISLSLDTATPWYRHLLFWVSIVLDVGTNYVGVLTWVMNDGAGRTIPLFTGIMLPTAGRALHGVTFGISLFLSTAPEIIGRLIKEEFSAIRDRARRRARQ